MLVNIMKLLIKILVILGAVMIVVSIIITPVNRGLFTNPLLLFAYLSHLFDNLLKLIFGLILVPLVILRAIVFGGEEGPVDYSDVTSETERLRDGTYKTTIKGRNYGCDTRFGRTPEESEEQTKRYYDHITHDK
jgi:hypothetical protein